MASSNLAHRRVAVYLFRDVRRATGVFNRSGALGVCLTSRCVLELLEGRKGGEISCWDTRQRRRVRNGVFGVISWCYRTEDMKYRNITHTHTQGSPRSRSVSQRSMVRLSYFVMFVSLAKCGVFDRCLQGPENAETAAENIITTSSSQSHSSDHWRPQTKQLSILPLVEQSSIEHPSTPLSLERNTHVLRAKLSHRLLKPPSPALINPARIPVVSVYVRSLRPGTS